jgi:DNA-binding ferritin-like protein
MEKFKLTLKAKPEGEIQIISELLNARTQFHVWHLQTIGTGSYAIHKALDSFYSNLSGYIDSLVETIQGKKLKILKGYSAKSLKDFASKEVVIKELDMLKETLESYRVSLPKNWANIDNQIQVIIDDIEQTTYKLTFLS